MKSFRSRPSIFLSEHLWKLIEFFVFIKVATNFYQDFLKIFRNVSCENIYLIRPHYDLIKRQRD